MNYDISIQLCSITNPYQSSTPHKSLRNTRNACWLINITSPYKTPGQQPNRNMIYINWTECKVIGIALRANNRRVISLIKTIIRRLWSKWLFSFLTETKRYETILSIESRKGRNTLICSNLTPCLWKQLLEWSKTSVSWCCWCLIIHRAWTIHSLFRAAYKTTLYMYRIYSSICIYFFSATL